MEVFKYYGYEIHVLKTYDDLILCNAAFEGNVNIIEFLLASLQASDYREKIKELLLETDEDGFSAWLITVVSNNTQVLEKLWEWAEKELRAKTLKYGLLLSSALMCLEPISKQSLWYTRRDRSML